MKYLIFLVFFAFHLHSFSQCVEDSMGNCIAKGKYKSVTFKTTMGTKYKRNLRTGLWQFFNEYGEKTAEGKYKISKQATYQEGEWQYFNSQGNLFLIRQYEKGFVTSYVFYDSGTVQIENQYIEAKSNSLGNLFVIEKQGTIVNQYTTAIKVDLSYNKVKNEAMAKLSKAVQVLQSSSGNNQGMSDLEDEVVFKQNVDSLFLISSPISKQLLNVPMYSVLTQDNLVLNANFEENSDAAIEEGSQIKPSNEKTAKHWFSARETPDIFKEDGNCFGGFRVFGVNFEVLGSTLSAPLKKGSTYCLQFKLKLKKQNTHAFNGVTVVAETEKKFFYKKSDFNFKHIVLQTHPNLVLGFREHWMNISGQFVANGDEKYLYFSNFTDSANLRLFNLDSIWNSGVSEIYYYIDDVMLKEVKEDTDCPCNVKACEIEEIPKPVSKQPKKGQTMVLRNIQFELDKSVLLPSSFNSLDSLVMFLEENPSMHIEIGGHTDNSGSDEHNLELSDDRAKSVGQYLLEHGIDADRFETKGYGSSVPLKPNDSEANRELNRRVEIKIL